MMKNIFLLIVGIVLSTQVFAQQENVGDENPNAPKFAFETTVLDYGNIKKGSDGERILNFTNAGKEPLIIYNVRSSCGCTVPEYPKTLIGPGEESQIKVKYNTNRVGAFHKTITIYSNAIGANKVLTVKGRVES